jgi:hypothetical protein
MNLGMSDALAAGAPANYFSFTVTPGAGYETTYDSVSLFTGVNGNNDQYNVDIRAWDGSTETSLGLVNRTPTGGTNLPIVKDTFDFANFTSASAVEFRLYGYNVSSAAGGVRYDDIIINGTTTAAIPEPSSAMLFGFGALALAEIARRRKQ